MVLKDGGLCGVCAFNHADMSLKTCLCNYFIDCIEEEEKTFEC